MAKCRNVSDPSITDLEEEPRLQLHLCTQPFPIVHAVDMKHTALLFPIISVTTFNGAENLLNKTLPLSFPFLGHRVLHTLEIVAINVSH